MSKDVLSHAEMIIDHCNVIEGIIEKIALMNFVGGMDPIPSRQPLFIEVFWLHRRDDEHVIVEQDEILCKIWNTVEIELDRI